MLSKQEEQQERLDVLMNEQRLRDQGSTFLDHTHNDVGGRFAAISSPVVVGANAIPKYPAAYLNHDPVPDEPPLGVSVNALEPTGEIAELKASVPSDLGPAPAQASPEPSSCEAQATDPNPASDVAPPLPDGVERRTFGLGLFRSRTFRRF